MDSMHVILCTCTCKVLSFELVQTGLSQTWSGTAINRSYEYLGADLYNISLNTAVGSHDNACACFRHHMT